MRNYIHINDLQREVYNECTCGGSGPYDKEACSACMIWHRLITSQAPDIPEGWRLLRYKELVYRNDKCLFFKEWVDPPIAREYPTEQCFNIIYITQRK